MKIKKTFLKKLLTTTSAFAVIAGASSSAMGAAAVLTTGANTVFGGAPGPGVVAFANGDHIKIANALHLNISTGADLVFGAAVDLDGKYAGNVGTLTAGHDITFGANNTIKLIVNAGHSNLALNNSLESVTVTGGQFTAADLTGLGNRGNLIVTGGKATVNDVANNVLLTGGTVTQTGTVGGILDVSNGGLYLGGAGADVAGVVTINTANAVINKLHNAAVNVTLSVGKLTMNDATGNVGQLHEIYNRKIPYHK